jgi:hypothetical protein
VTKLAEDRAEQLKRDPDEVLRELEQRLRADLRKMGDFNRVHPLPGSGADVPDDLDARLVVLGIDHVYSKDAHNAAEREAKAILESRGSAPRLYRNALVFLAADKTRLQDLEDVVRKYLAWESILNEKDTLDLSPHQMRQAETQKAAADSAVTARFPEAYQWLLVPIQQNLHTAMEWQAIRLSGQEALAVRASKKLRNEELLVTSLGATILCKYLDDVPLWRGEHVAIKQLVDDFGRYLYLPRLKDSSVLLGAIRDGFGLLTWAQDAFAYAESYDEAARRYRGLRGRQNVSISESDAGLLVRPEVARRQLDAETAPLPHPPGATAGPEPRPGPEPKPPVFPGPAPSLAPPPKPRRYYGTVTLTSERAGRDASRVADEVIAHLVGLVGASVRITLEIEAEFPDGAPEAVVRTVTENCRTLKFTSYGFERE